MNSQNKNKLAQYYDGELSHKASKEIEALLGDSAQSSETVRNWARIGDLIRKSNEIKAEGISFDGFEQRVLNSLESKAKSISFREKFRVWVAEFLEHRKVVWVPAASLAGIAAAVLLALPLASPTNMQPQNIVPVAPQAQHSVWIASVDKNDNVQGGSEVLLVGDTDVSSKDHEFEVINDRGESIGVIWVEK